MADPENETIQAIIAQMSELREALAQQQATIAEQRAEIAGLRAEVAGRHGSDVGERRKTAEPMIAAVPARKKRGRATSRRRLLVGAGAAAASATVALVASEGQMTHAKPAPDNSSLLLGVTNNSNNTASTTTTLSVDTTPSHNVSPLFVVDVTASTNGAPVAIQGTSSTGTGVVGTSNETGVYGNGGLIGVNGHSTNGPGVNGSSTNGYGMQAGSTNGIGLQASSGTSIDLWAAGTGRIQQTVQASAGAPTSGSHSKGEQIRDLNGELWLCVVDGTPGTWKQVFAAGSSITTAAQTTLQAASSSTPGTLLVVDVSAASGNQNGISGTAVGTGYGVQGVSTGTGHGVHGNSANGDGVVGLSTNSIGVVAQSTSYIDLVAGGTGRFQQVLQGSAGAPSSGAHFAGEMIRDNTGDLWLCVADGTPGHWVMASHAVYGYTGGATSYLSKPIRLLDTRSGSTDALTNGGGPYTSGGSPYPVTIAGVSFMSVTVPSSCAGAIGNVTVVAGGGGGYLALVPHGAGFSGTANLAYGAGQIVSNAFNVGLSVDGKLDIIIGGNPTDVILDLFAVVA